jgi:hypothetical protein
MKRKLIALSGFMIFSLIFLGQRLEKLWETDTLFKVPESVLPDVAGARLFISNIDGASGGKDGKGHITVMGTDGKIKIPVWASGLNAPKGMGIFGKNLYAADLDAIVVFQLKTGKETERIEIAGAKFLNDLTIDENGTIYVSDSETGIIHKIEKGQKPKAIITGRTRPNGVLWHQNKLWFLDAGGMFVFDNGNTTQIASGMERSTDGIEPIDGERFLVSAWIGTMYVVNKNGTVQEILNTKDQKVNCADIGYDRKNKIVYVPTFNANRVAAYRLILE